ncbi:uncharacterized protein [Aquarana catesbeiana]
MKDWPFVCWCLVIYPQGLVSIIPCAPTKSLSVGEGEDVILQLDLNDTPLTSVTWDLEKYLIARTKPGQPVEMRDHRLKYTGRLSSNLKDGSLIIQSLSSNDMRVYRAELFNRENNYVCAQLYALGINGKDWLTPGIVASADTCGEIRSHSDQGLGDTVTLQPPIRSEVAFIEWYINSMDHIAVTRPGHQLESQANVYSNRLTASSDGSLKLSGMTTNEERVFKADVFTGTWVYKCAQLFDVKLKRASLSKACAPMKSLSVEEGEDVVLQLDLNNIPLTSASWNYEKFIIATTKPSQPLEMGDHGSDYTGRLDSSLKDGSLIIRSLSSNDIRIYRAELFTSEMKYICAQIYDLRISGNNGLSPSIAEPNESCTATRQLFHRLGDTVTLQVPSRSGVASIFWDINNIDHLAITRPGQIARQNYCYSRRLSATSDGSLRLPRITATDERVFRAELFTDNWVHYCTQLFEVKLQKKKSTMPSVIYQALSGCVLLVAVLILLHHIRTECIAN